VRQVAHRGGRDRRALHHRRLDRQRRRRLDERRHGLRERDRIGFGVSHRGHAGEVLLERLERGALDGAPGERVLDDLVSPLRAADLPAQIGDLRNRQSLVVEQDRAVRSLEGRFQTLELGRFVRLGDRHQCFTTTSMCVVSMRTPGPIVDDSVTLFRYLPLPAAGLAFTMLSTSACAFAMRASLANDLLPTGAWMMPVLSTRNSTLPALISLIAFAMSVVTVPVFGFGISPRGPSTLPSLPTPRIMSGVATTASKSMKPVL